MHTRVAALTVLMLVGSCRSASPAPEPNSSPGLHDSCAACGAVKPGVLPLGVVVRDDNVHDSAIEAFERLFKDNGFVVKTNPGKSKKNPLRPGLARWPDVILYAAGEGEPVAIVKSAFTHASWRPRFQPFQAPTRALRLYTAPRLPSSPTAIT